MILWFRAICFRVGMPHIPILKGQEVKLCMSIIQSGFEQNFKSLSMLEYREELVGWSPDTTLMQDCFKKATN